MPSGPRAARSLLRWFAGEEPHGDRGGLLADGLEAVHVAADQSESEVAREYRIHGRAGRGGHLPGDVGRPERLAGAVPHHGKEQDDRVSGQTCHLLEKLRQRQTREMVELEVGRVRVHLSPGDVLPHLVERVRPGHDDHAVRVWL